MIVGIFIVFYIIVSLFLSVYLHHHSENNITNITFLLLSFFCCLNILIAFWEIALGWHIKHIQQEANVLAKKYARNPFDAVITFFNTRVGLSDTFSLKFWSKVWSTYRSLPPLFLFYYFFFVFYYIF